MTLINPDSRVCPRCGRGWGYGNCTHHPPCDRVIEKEEPNLGRLGELIRDAYARRAPGRIVETQGIIEPEYLV